MTNGENNMAAEFTDRKLWLTIIGGLEVLIGLAAVLIAAALMVVGLLKKTGGESISSMGTNGMLMAAILYGVTGVILVWIGIGSIMTRKWARAVMLAASWIFLGSGIIGMLNTILTFNAMAGMAEKLPEALMAAMKVFMFFMGLLILVVIPSLLIYFHSRNSVIATCEYYDPKPRWTDRLPIPVLMTFLLALSCTTILTIGLFFTTQYPVPFCGIVLKSLPAKGILLLCVLLSLFIAWRSYKLDVKACWVALFAVSASCISYAVTIANKGIIGIYEASGFNETELEAMRQVFKSDTPFIINAVAYLVVCGGFLLWAKKYFKQPQEESSALSGTDTYDNKLDDYKQV